MVCVYFIKYQYFQLPFLEEMCSALCPCISVDSIFAPISIRYLVTSKDPRFEFIFIRIFVYFLFVVYFDLFRIWNNQIILLFFKKLTYTSKTEYKQYDAINYIYEKKLWWAKMICNVREWKKNLCDHFYHTFCFWYFV